MRTSLIFERVKGRGCCLFQQVSCPASKDRLVAQMVDVTLSSLCDGNGSAVGYSPYHSLLISKMQIVMELLWGWSELIQKTHGKNIWFNTNERYCSIGFLSAMLWWQTPPASGPSSDKAQLSLTSPETICGLALSLASGVRGKVQRDLGPGIGLGHPVGLCAMVRRMALTISTHILLSHASPVDKLGVSKGRKV